MKEVVRLKLSPDSALGLQKSISSRFRHKRHVTVKSADELHAISFFPEGYQLVALSGGKLSKDSTILFRM